MKIELLGMLDYEKIKTELKEKVKNVDEVIDMLKKNETEKRAQIVSSAGRLSRFTGNVFDVLEMSENNSFEKNLKFIKRVTGMGHDSITDHDYLVFAIQDVSPVIEQIIIAERFCSFTIKSRREVDFSNVGFYTPNFHDDNGNVAIGDTYTENSKNNVIYAENKKVVLLDVEDLFCIDSNGVLIIGKKDRLAEAHNYRNII